VASNNVAKIMEHRPMTHPSNGHALHSISSPRRCVECGNVAVEAAVIPYDAKIKHGDKLHAFPIDALPVLQCAVCGEVYFTSASSDEKSQALRQHLDSACHCNSWV
jgi:YgiT-type zinc finger domain-containing protein